MNRRSFCQAATMLPGLLAVRPLFAQTHDHAAMSGGDGDFNPFIVSDARAGFLVAFVRQKNGMNDVLLQRSLPNGDFSPPVRVNDRQGDGAVRNENPPKIALGGNGEIYVVWASERERWKGNIRFARSTDGGKSFSKAIDLNSDASMPPVSRAFESIAVDSKGRVFVAWIDERNKKESDRGAEIWMAVSDDGGRTFQQDRRALSNVCECCRTALATDSDGNVYVSYRTVPAAGPMFRDIAVARSTDNGRTFRPSVVHSDRWELNACPIDGATMTSDSSGRLHVVWFTQQGDTPRLYLATSSDHGLSFSSPVVFDPSQKVAKHAHAVAAADNRLLIAWDDINGSSLIKWGLYDPANRSMKLLGTRTGATYPVIARSQNRMGLVALQSEGGVFRAIGNL